jgi:hypothetical protein
MNPEASKIIHIGVNFVFAPGPTINRRKNLEFQNALLEQGVEFDRIEILEDAIAVTRESPGRLEIKVATGNVDPVGPVGQIIIVSPDPTGASGDTSRFIKDAEAVAEAFRSTWGAPHLQVLSCDAALRALFESSSDHAFQELWEIRLKQPSDSLVVLGRPVLGGGLRLVMPPLPDDPERLNIEVKIESYLQDTKLIFVEAQFVWPQPALPGEPLDPKSRIEQIDQYVENEIVSFITGGNHEHDE